MFDAVTTDPPIAGWSDETYAPLRASLETGGLLLDLLREEQQAIGAAPPGRPPSPR